ncbi:MAG: molybdopterin-binding protein [Anaerolineae bacterium]|nr:molybdopterin-binding protein [Anaerolineae bacterium]
MSEFLTLLPPPDALRLLLENLVIEPQPERVPSAESLHRVVVDSVIAPLNLPSFIRATVDGYAVHSADTHGAGESLPAYLKLVGEVRMGTMPVAPLQSGQCMIIHTGGMLPEGADAVVMVEHTQQALTDEIEILRAVGVGENVLNIGEDVRRGDEVIAPGTRLRSAEIGGLMALGITHIVVARKPRVAILSSGDEVIPPGEPLSAGQVYDVNSYTLATSVERAGGKPVIYGIIPDNPAAFRHSAERALRECDIVVFTAGSSVSARDLTAQTIDQLGQPGVLVHGVNVRPGKPTILAVCNGKAVIGLPGNPVSALIIAGIFVTPLLDRWLGLQSIRPKPFVTARLTVNLSSASGREDWIAVRLIPTAAGYDAEPLFGKSNLIFTLARADGLMRIHPDANGVAAGSSVKVQLL